MFGSKRRRQREAQARANEYLDLMEERMWDLQVRNADERVAVADIVEGLVHACDDDPALIVRAYEEWHTAKAAQLAPDHDRSNHLTGMQLSIALVGIGNLMGYIPENAPLYNIDLAREGQRRGWRR